MILFYDDWQDFPGSIIDTKTTNTSFLKLAAIYREMGIKNHAFILALHNKDLQGIDPHDLAVLNSPDLMTAITLECFENPWYFFREVARVPGRGSPVPVKFNANRGNIALIWLYFNHITTIYIQIRQTGKTTTLLELITYLNNIKFSHTESILLTKDEYLRTRTLGDLKEYQSILPVYLNQKTPADIFNTEEFTVKSLHNKFTAFLAAASPKAAIKLGRGFTVGTFFGDEAAFLNNISISLPAALSAGTAARDIARLNDLPYGTILATTAGKKDDRDGKYIYNMLQSSAVWSERLFDLKNQEQLENVIRNQTGSKNVRVNLTINHRQLGLTDEWLERAILESESTGDAARRDFLNQWTSGTQLSPISTENAEMIRDCEREPINLEIANKYNYVIRWHADPSIMLREDHVLSIDSSDAAGGDDIALTIRNVRTGAVTAAGNYNETNLLLWCEWLVTLFVKYEKFVAIIERRSTGGMIIDFLIVKLIAAGIDPFKRIYNKVVQEAEEFPDRFKEIQKPLYARDNDVVVKYKKTFGFATSGGGMTSRSDLYGNTLQHAIKYTGNIIYDSTIINQLLGLVIKNGRVDHEDGEHDDNCISWLLSHWLLIHGKNLNFYGINSRDILADNVKTKVEIKNQSSYDFIEQRAIQNKLDELTEALKKEKDTYAVMRLEHQLKFYYNKLTETGKVQISYDDLIRQIKDQRRVSSIKGDSPGTRKSYLNYRNR